MIRAQQVDLTVVKWIFGFSTVQGRCRFPQFVNFHRLFRTAQCFPVAAVAQYSLVRAPGKSLITIIEIDLRIRTSSLFFIHHMFSSQTK
jgi:hypothetical protein